MVLIRLRLFTVKVGRFPQSTSANTATPKQPNWSTNEQIPCSGSMEEASSATGDPCGAAEAINAEVEEHTVQRKQMTQDTCRMLTNMQHDVEDTLAGLEVMAHESTPPANHTAAASPSSTSHRVRSPVGTIKAWDVGSLLGDGGDVSTLYTEVIREAAEQRTMMLERATAVSQVLLLTIHLHAILCPCPR